MADWSSLLLPPASNHENCPSFSFGLFCVCFIEHILHIWTENENGYCGDHLKALCTVEGKSGDGRVFLSSRGGVSASAHLCWNIDRGVNTLKSKKETVHCFKNHTKKESQLLPSGSLELSHWETRLKGFMHVVWCIVPQAQRSEVHVLSLVPVSKRRFIHFKHWDAKETRTEEISSEKSPGVPSYHAFSCLDKIPERNN